MCVCVCQGSKGIHCMGHWVTTNGRSKSAWVPFLASAASTNAGGSADGDGGARNGERLVAASKDTHRRGYCRRQLGPVR